MMTYQTIQDFINLAIENGTIDALDEIYWRNQLLQCVGLSDWAEVDTQSHEKNSLVLMDQLMALAAKNGKIEAGNEEFFESALMDFITPKPSRINKTFWTNYEQSPELATASFYKLAKQINQVKTRDIAKNIAFEHETNYGNLEITINLSKPEKDPKLIAAAKLVKATNYPACQLCIENEGYYGHANHPARSNHRIIKCELNGEKWGFQYSPYAYFNEHSILLNEVHQPMEINGRAFANLLAFLDKFPHYMIGSNADLPIVGGSILTHDHYQAGNHAFPMAKAGLKKEVTLAHYPKIKAGIVNWPMSVLRLQSTDKASILEAATDILAKWKLYSDKSLEIKAVSADGTPHHTITPIARMHDGQYEMDLVLRDNNVSSEFPDGIFHPHQKLHHIKKENIGLIEVMGLAILPPRLKTELREVEKYLLDEQNQMAEMHKPWADQLKSTGHFTSENVEELVRQAVGNVFKEVLEDAGVFKTDATGQAGFDRFVAFLNE
ncbi:MAG: UDP-glucose--hexose-1-phosphate uridylyltransferase [Lactococcus sp.]